MSASTPPYFVCEADPDKLGDRPRACGCGAPGDPCPVCIAGSMKTPLGEGEEPEASGDGAGGLQASKPNKNLDARAAWKCFAIIGGHKQPRIDVSRQASILLVDDDLKGREAIATMVQELGHRVVAAAATIRDASARDDSRLRPAILNISIDGYRIDPVAHLLQRRQRPILFITCSGMRWLPSRFRGHSVLQKPISIEELKETIEAIIDPEATVS